MNKGFLSRTLALLIAAVCLLSCCVASADVVKGSVSHGFYDNNNGISFTVPEGFTLSQQQNKESRLFPDRSVQPDGRHRLRRLYHARYHSTSQEGCRLFL